MRDHQVSKLYLKPQVTRKMTWLRIELYSKTMDSVENWDRLKKIAEGNPDEQKVNFESLLIHSCHQVNSSLTFLLQC